MRGTVRASWAFGPFARHPPPAWCWPGQSDIAIEPKSQDQHNWPMVLGHTLVLPPGRFTRLAKGQKAWPIRSSNCSQPRSFAFMIHMSDSIGISIVMKKETLNEDPDGAYFTRSTRQHWPQDGFLAGRICSAVLRFPGCRR